MKEVKAWFILRELFFLLLFLGVLFAISFANRDVEHSHQLVDHLRKEFLSIDYKQQHKYTALKNKRSLQFDNIDSIDSYWDWLENVFGEKYLKTIWIDKNEKRSRVQYFNRSNRNIGWPTLRQLRVKNGND